MNICKMATSKTQVNFDMQHNHTLCTSSNTQVCENYDYTLALKIKRYPIFSKYTHIDSVL